MSCRLYNCDKFQAENRNYYSTSSRAMSSFQFPTRTDGLYVRTLICAENVPLLLVAIATYFDSYFLAQKCQHQQSRHCQSVKPELKLLVKIQQGKNLQVLHLLQGTKKFRNRAVFQSKINSLGVELKVAVVIQNYVKALMQGAQIQQ